MLEFAAYSSARATGLIYNVHLNRMRLFETSSSKPTWHAVYRPQSNCATVVVAAAAAAAAAAAGAATAAEWDAVEHVRLLVN